ncbi:hypothetical protein [Microbispora sp. H10885]|uniref:hypothetical protein n=1 Tax=Microbispora sp. H10885 TaxID=2729110 RepID=UPI001603FA88|nr:hypothetical protein [Microbispora sp. H10885]
MSNDSDASSGHPASPLSKYGRRLLQGLYKAATLSAIALTVATAYTLIDRIPAPAINPLSPVWILTGALLSMPYVALGVLDRLRRGRDRRRLDAAADEPGKRLNDRIRAVSDAFTEAATLMNELQRDLKAQQAARETLLTEAQRQQKLLEVDKEQAEKIREILIGETKATIRAERRQQLLFFALGLVASVPIGVLVNWIS